MPVKQHEARPDLRYVEGLLAIEVGGSNRRARTEALAAIVGENEGWEVASRDQLVAEFGDDALVDRVTEFVDVVAVDDPLEAAERLRDRPDVSAAPIHTVGFSWHSPMTGTRPEPAPKDTTFDHVPPGRERVIAVVDTGVVESSRLPEWMTSSIVRGEADIDSPGAEDKGSHGTFVASLLRQIAPTHGISMAKAASLSGDEPRGDEHPEPDPTTEFHVADAIHRLIARHRGDNCVVEALNLSVGGPSAGNTTMVTVRSAIARWRETFPGAPIFAAAGNTPDSAPIYPAAFGYVRGVAAGNHDGRQIVWDGNNQPTPAGPRHWVTDVAPGAGLIGLGGMAADHAIAWGGSSFATAVATASYVNGGPLEVRADVAYWPNRAMRYADVPGLQFA